MTKQEEIREGIADILGRNWGDNWEVHNKVTKELISYLHSQGVVIKVDWEEATVEMKAGEIPLNKLMEFHRAYKTGWVPVKSLIEEE